jgi:aryl-alcohol dehydrogenase-like predicted oxidoreductase
MSASGSRVSSPSSSGGFGCADRPRRDQSPATYAAPMRYVEADGVRLSAIGVGTWQFGSKEWGYGPDYARTTARAIVNRALDLGVNLIDTAEIYGLGQSERIVGAAISGRRDQAFVASKLFPVAPISPVVEWRAVESAARLGVTGIDLYQVHWPNPLFPIGPTMAAMSKLQRVGLVDRVGVSNFNLLQWRLAERKLGGPVLTNQVQYSLVARKPDRELVPYAQTNDRVIIAYSPLGQGLLGGRYDVDHPAPPGVRSNNPLFLLENLERAHPLLTALREIATTHGATPAQVALAWVIRRPNVVAIPGASSVAQLEANIAAGDLELSDDDDARLTGASDAFDPIRGLAAVPGMIEARRARRSPSSDEPQTAEEPAAPV